MFKLRVVQAQKGDCLVLVYGTHAPHYMLIDGGPGGVFDDHLSAELQRIKAAGGKLDRVVLSHIDDDHAHGLLDFLSRLVDQQTQKAQPLIAVDEFWHNTFSQMLGPQTAARAFAQLKADTADTRRALAPEPDTFLMDVTARSIDQGDKLTTRAGTLRIPINPQFAPFDFGTPDKPEKTANPMICADAIGAPLSTENLSIRILGPTRARLAALRSEWTDWLNRRATSKALDTSYTNLSSIMFLVESTGGKRILFTGDGRGDEVVAALTRAGLLGDKIPVLEVDVLKMPHHGSIHNAPPDFFKRVRARHYVISADGENDNPDAPTLMALTDARKADGQPYTIWITNETPSTVAFRSQRPPSDDYRYRFVQLAYDTPAAQQVLELDVEAADPAAAYPPLPGPYKAVEIKKAKAGADDSTRTEDSSGAGATAGGSGQPLGSVTTGQVEVLTPTVVRRVTAKRALLVGINNFINPAWTLHGCINDTADMLNLLTTCYGFDPQDILILQDQQATAKGIRDGMAWLLSDYAGHDTRVFHFSSHGDQVDDKSGDELEWKDDIIIPYDHDFDTNVFLDDELGATFDKAVSPGVNLTFIADCCHSGTIDRVLRPRSPARELPTPPEIDDRIDALRIQRVTALTQRLIKEGPGWVREGKLARGDLQKSPLEIISKLTKILGKKKPANRDILLAACQDRQTAADAQIDGEGRGAFTWGLTKAVREANGEITYADLIARATSNVALYGQNPRLTCPPSKRNLKLFAPLR